MRQRQRCTVEILCTLWAVLGVKHRSHITGGWHNRLYIRKAVLSRRYAWADWPPDDWPLRLCKSDGSKAANPC